jgi:hypothetical protein
VAIAVKIEKKTKSFLWIVRKKVFMPIILPKKHGGWE